MGLLDTFDLTRKLSRDEEARRLAAAQDRLLYLRLLATGCRCPAAGSAACCWVATPTRPTAGGRRSRLRAAGSHRWRWQRGEAPDDQHQHRRGFTTQGRAVDVLTHWREQADHAP